MDTRQNNDYGDRGYFLADEFRQNERFTYNNNSRFPICFCVDVSGSMSESISLFGDSRITLLSKVMRNLLEAMQSNPRMSEQACVSVITYAKFASTMQPFLDVADVNVRQATSFTLGGNTRFTEGLSRSLQQIDSYINRIIESDNNTFTPMLIFMTDGEPVGDDMGRLEDIYRQIHKRIRNKQLHVFPIGISRNAQMGLLKALTPDSEAYRMDAPDEYTKVFDVIRKIVDDAVDTGTSNEGSIVSAMASQKEETLDTGSGEDMLLQFLQKIGSDI